jgi:hypothetical protein
LLEGDPRLSKLEGFVTEWDKDGRPLRMVNIKRNAAPGEAPLEMTEIKVEENGAPPTTSGGEDQRPVSEMGSQKRRVERWEQEEYTPSINATNGGEPLSKKESATQKGKKGKGKKKGSKEDDGEHGGGCRCVIM